MRRLLRSMVIALKAAITITIAWIADVTMRTATGEANGLGRTFLPVFLAGTAGPVIFCLVKLSRL